MRCLQAACFLSSAATALSSAFFPSKNKPNALFQSVIGQGGVLASAPRLFAKAPGNNDDGGSGYKFGDITRFLAKTAANKVNEVTGKEEYTPGDLSRFLDGRAKERVQAMKVQKGGTYKYEFGDMARWADSLAKEHAAKFAGKEKAEDYRLGDISRTIISKVSKGEYDLEDVYLTLRVLLAAGFRILPIANLLPIRVLMELVNLGLAKDVGGRLTGVLATTVDARMKQALTGDENYRLGDITKERLQSAASALTGKGSYEFGDISRSIFNQTPSESKTKSFSISRLDEVKDELTDWDKKILSKESSTSNSEKLAARQLSEWDAKMRDGNKA